MSECLNWFDPRTFAWYLMIVPGLIIVGILQFYQRYKDNIFKLLVPFKFLQNNDTNRVPITLAFGIMSGSLVNYVIIRPVIKVSWPLEPFVVILMLVLLSLILYPLLICIDFSHWKLSNLLGAGYLVTYLLYLLLLCFQTSCGRADEYVWFTFAEKMPEFICIVLLFGIFIKRLVSVHYPYRDLLLPHQKKYVTRLCNQSHHLERSKTFFERYVWEKDPCFLYPAIVLIPITISIVSWYFIVLLACYTITLYKENFPKIFHDSLITAAVITVVIFTVQLYFFLKSFKKDFQTVLRRGQVNNNPYQMTKAEILRNYTIFPGYLIAFTIIGVAVIFAILFVAIFILHLALKSRFYKEIFISVGKLLYKFLVGGLLVMIAQRLMIQFVFTANVDRNDSMSVNHFSWYHLNLYFTMFLNLSIGFGAFLWTSVVTFFVNMLFTPRFDRLMMNPKYFKRIYFGHRGYQATVKLEAMFKNPTMRCFCHLLLEAVTYVQKETDTSFNQIHPRLRNPLSKNRWFLAVTLMRNPSLAQYRKRNIADNSSINEVKLTELICT